MSNVSSKNDLQEYRAAMKRMNDWEHRHPERYDPSTALQKVFDLYQFARELRPREEEPYDPSGILRLLEISAKASRRNS